MSEDTNVVVAFKPKPKMSEWGVPVIRKEVDGKIVEYVNLDAMSPEMRERYFLQAGSGQ